MKKLLSKLFGSKSEEEPQSQHKARSPRVRIPGSEEAAYVANGGKSYVLRNLSETGLALQSPGEHFPDESWGEIRVAGERVAVRIKTMRRNGDEVGAVIVDGGAGVRALLRRAFTDEIGRAHV